LLSPASDAAVDTGGSSEKLFPVPTADTFFKFFKCVFCCRFHSLALHVGMRLARELPTIKN
jgi:hypothetical protein